MLALSRCHLHYSELVQCAAWTRSAYGVRDQTSKNKMLYRGSDIGRHPGPKRAHPLRGRDVLVQEVLPTSAQRHDVAVSEFE